MIRIGARGVSAVLLATCLAFAAPIAAVAGTTSATTVTFSQLKAYHVAQRAYLAQLKLINAAFAAAVAAAKADYVAALAVATSAGDRITARATLHSAIAAATVTRASALTALGKPPVNPEKPRH